MTSTLVTNLQDLYISELRDLYSAETQLTDALPRMAQAANHEQLRSAFNEHLQETKSHLARLEMIFKDLGVKPKGMTCKAMKGLISEGEDMIRDTQGPARDAGLIAAAQRVEHYEIAGYGTVRTYADSLGFADSAKLLQTTLNEEAKTNETLTTLAETVCNNEAKERSR